MSRDKLLAHLWPETETERGRHLLSNAVYALRQALGRNAILAVGGDTLRLNEELIRVDLWDFLNALEEEHPETAVGLYTGPFLDGFFVSEAPEFERWIESERDRLARLYAEVLEALALDRESARDLRGAVAWWRKLAAHDPFSSRIALRLMRALVAAGDRGGALQHARIHAALLRNELDVEPDGDVVEFVGRLRAGRPPPQPEEPASSAPQRQPQSPRSDHIPAAAVSPGFASTEAPDGGSIPRPGLHRSRPPQRRNLRRLALATAALLPLTVAGFLYGARRPANPIVESAPVIRSLAVLPLENCTPDRDRAGGPDAEQEYFADGLTDALITELAQIPALRVISRTSSMRYKRECGSPDRREKSLPEIARELGVDAVVEGTLVRDGDWVRVNAQLIRAATDEHLWAGGLEYEREVRDVIALQRDIVADIAGSIRSQPNVPRVSHRPGDRRTDPAAYASYLKGRYLWNEHQLASHREALDYFQRAADIDPGFAPAYAGMADVYVHLDEWGARPEKGARSKGFEAARRALQLDEGLSEAHASLAHLLMHVEDWEAAGRAYRRAIQLNPNNGNARILYAFYLSALERHDEAIEQAVRALQVDPLAERTNSFAGYTFYFAGRYDEAITQWRRLLELDAQNTGAHFLIGLAHLNGGRHSEGLAWARRGAALAKDAPGARVALAHSLALAGQQEEGREVLDEVVRQADVRLIDPLSLGKAYGRLGDRDAAFYWLDVAVQGDHGWLMFLRVDPGYGPLRSDPRFVALLRELRLEG